MCHFLFLLTQDMVVEKAGDHNDTKENQHAAGHTDGWAAKGVGNARQLRGEIVLSKTAGVGGLTQNESTSHTGIQRVECFIVKSSVCVARSGEFVVRIE